LEIEGGARAPVSHSWRRQWVHAMGGESGVDEGELIWLYGVMNQEDNDEDMVDEMRDLERRNNLQWDKIHLIVDQNFARLCDH